MLRTGVRRYTVAQREEALELQSESLDVDLELVSLLAVT